MTLESIRKRVEAAKGWTPERAQLEIELFDLMTNHALTRLLAVAEAAKEVGRFHGIEWEGEWFAAAHERLCAALKAVEEAE